jgi:hypothetical protein
MLTLDKARRARVAATTANAQVRDLASQLTALETKHRARLDTVLGVAIFTHAHIITHTHTHTHTHFLSFQL